MAGINVTRQWQGVDYGPATYVQDVRGILKVIEGNAAGQVIINAINATGKDLTIYPYEAFAAMQPGAAHCNAVTGGSVNEAAPARQIEASRQAGDQLRGKAYYGDPSNPQDHVPERDGQGKPIRLAGGGVKSLELFFSPGSWGKSGCFSGGPGALSDEVLLHELVHSLRRMQGVSNPVPTGNEYVNEEEYLAIVIANVYISVRDKASAKLRAGYGDPNNSSTWYLPLRPPLDTSYGFIRDVAGYNNWKLLTYYSNNWRGVFLDLANFSAIFNPFWAIRYPQRQH